MVRKFSINCDFGGAKAPFDFYVGMPKDGNHPIGNQVKWLGDNKGGTPPADIMDSFSKILKLSIEHNVDFEELCVHAFNEAYRIKEQKDVEAPQKAQQVQQVQQQAAAPSRGIGGGGGGQTSAPQRVAPQQINEQKPVQQPVKQEVAPPPPPPRAVSDPIVQKQAPVLADIEPLKAEQPTKISTPPSAEVRSEPKFEPPPQNAAPFQNNVPSSPPVQPAAAVTNHLQSPAAVAPAPVTPTEPVQVINNSPAVHTQTVEIKPVSTPKPISNVKKEEDDNILDW